MHVIMYEALPYDISAYKGIMHKLFQTVMYSGNVESVRESDSRI